MLTPDMKHASLPKPRIGGMRRNFGVLNWVQKQSWSRKSHVDRWIGAQGSFEYYLNASLARA